MSARHFFLVLGLSAAALSAAAQGIPTFPQDEVLVIVWKEGNRCSVLERKTTCTRVAGLMTGVMQIGRDRHIVVATEGNDSEVKIRAAQLMTDIKAAGYRRVRPAGTYQ